MPTLHMPRHVTAPTLHGHNTPLSEGNHYQKSAAIFTRLSILTGNAHDRRNIPRRKTCIPRLVGVRLEHEGSTMKASKRAVLPSLRGIALRHFVPCFLAASLFF